MTAAAPDAERSAVGHAITTLLPLRVKEFSLESRKIGYSINGTPADCVKLAVGGVIEGLERPDLVVSGINLGPNTATNIIYSGTVSAATEARILGIPSIAVSLGTFVEPRWEEAARFARKAAELVLANGLPEKVLLNINVPNLAREQIKGVRVTRQGDSTYEESFKVGEDPRRQPYYWLAGAYEMNDTEEDTDAWAVENGFVSVTPITFDLTARGHLTTVEGWGFRL